ncbi:AbrB family transcriptional regulator [Pseudodesulfovibrio sp.]|uniref:AbrB family transcriptional regulator n=1 Tax=Pseudodesulfovibrio sp. TaxID=2035812 RepID=UPI0026224AD5|nr:AbrB family transcriptional regulator [Pseudodesulfovibrio sp.]MDD3310596.1 AbrB family transcriptional regulator [Pseudodesulfovibrio sp.]
MQYTIARTGLWAALTLVSALLSALLHWADLPAAALLGPMVAGVFFALRGANLAVPRWAFIFAQAVLGVLVARSVTPSVFHTFVSDWPVIGLAIATIVLSGSLAGFALMHLGTLPGSTAAWGSSPGGATVMTALAEAHGADIRMVAFMQYLRLFVVVVTASAVSHLLLGQGAPPDAGGRWDLGLSAPLAPVLETVVLVVGGAAAASRLSFPSAPLLVPMAIGLLLNSTGVVHLTLPNWLVALTYFLLGWYIGLRFTGPMVRYALRAVPQILLAVAGLILLCCGAAWMLHAWAGTDWLTAYLATSPGGLDTVIAIALSSRCDIPFVLCLQTARLFTVILVSPLAARLISRVSERRGRERPLP